MVTEVRKPTLEEVHGLSVATMIAACVKRFGLNGLEQHVRTCVRIYIDTLREFGDATPERPEHANSSSPKPKVERPGRDEAQYFRSIGGTTEQLAEIIKLCKAQGLLYSQELQKLFADGINNPSEIVRLLTPKALPPSKEADPIKEMDGGKARIAFDDIAQGLNWPKVAQAPLLYCRFFSKQFGRVISETGRLWDDEWREAYRFILKVRDEGEPVPSAITKWQEDQAVLPTNAYDHVYRGAKD